MMGGPLVAPDRRLLLWRLRFRHPTSDGCPRDPTPLLWGALPRAARFWPRVFDGSSPLGAFARRLLLIDGHGFCGAR